MFRKSISVLLTVCILLTVILPVVQAEERDGMSDAARAEAYLSNLDAENSALEEEEPPKKAAGITLAEMTARAEAIVNYAWTPSQNITTWNSNKYNGLTYFPAGQTVKGMPYTLFTSEVVSQSLCSLERYKTLASSNYSATKYCNSVGATRTGPVYGSCCADLVCEVFGGNFMSGSSPRYHSVTYIKNSSYGTTTSNVPISQLRPGDAVSDTAVTHILWIGAVTDTQITFYEQTPPIARKVTVNKASCTNSNGYFVYDGHVYNIVTRSNEFVSTPLPNAPGRPDVTVSYDSVTVSWNDVSNETSYDVYLLQEPWGWADIKYSKTVSANTTSAKFTNVSDGKYCAFVIARPNADSVQSDWCSFEVNLEKPAVPVITASSEYIATGDTITISWDPVLGASSYLFYMAEYPYGFAYENYLVSDTVYTNSVSFQANNLPNGRYVFFVHAYNAAGYGDQSNWVYFDVYNKDYVPVKIEMFNDHIYAVYDYDLSWTFAEQMCQNAGGHLVSITSQEENDFVCNLIAGGNKDGYWIGARNDNSDGGWNGNDNEFYWTSGEPFNYANWKEGEPNSNDSGADKEHFAEIRKSYDNQWNDMANKRLDTNGFVLEIDTSDWTPVASTTYGTSKYILYNGRKTWSEARFFCEKNGGHLVTISSTEEDSVITDLLQEGKTPWVYVGAYASRGTWKWVDGSTVPLSGSYANWSDVSGTSQTGPTGWGDYLMKYKSNGGWIGIPNYYYGEEVKNLGFVMEVENAVHTATFNPNGGTVSQTSKQIVFGDEYGELPVAQRTNYNFNGWYTSSEGGVEITSTSVVNKKASVTLYAHWTHVCENGHNYSYKATTNPTTSATGVLTGTCSKCSGTTTVTLPKLNTTDYTKTTTKSATCTEGGTDSYKWKTTTYGTFTFTVATSAKGHTSVTDKAVAATCTATGLTEGSHCSVCNAVIKAQTTVAALGHSYTSKVTAPTCTAQGYTTYTCSRCSNSYKDSYTNATGHSYTYKATKNPTTSATGTLTGTCSKCSGTTTVTLPKLNTTDYTKTTTKSATCTEGGTDSYKWKTTTYGTFTFTVATSAKGHTSVTDKAVAATCTATGLTEGSHCSVCNAVIKAQTTVAALGHNYSSKVTAPTCTAQGYTTYTCSRCSNSYKDSYTNATGHSYTYKATTNPTTSATGVLTGTCSKCSGTTTVTLPKLNTTDYTKTTTKSATCTEGGTDSYKWKTTTYGTFSFTVATSAKGHTSVTDKAVAATCTATGLTEGSHCSVCNAVIKAQTTVAALGHNYSSKVTAPTCTAQGYTTYTCSRCSNSYKDSYTNATGHSYTYKATTNPTTSATGVLTGTCSKCSGTTTVTLPKLNTTDYTKTTTKSATCTEGGTDSYKWKTTTYGTFTFTVATSAKGHTSVTDKAVAATCTAAGKAEGSHCSVCNAVIKAQTTVAALGHSYTSKVTAPTCTAQGYTTYTCSRCADSYKDTYTDAIGHNYTYTDCGETHEGVCENCSNKVTESHNYSDGNCICGAIEIAAPITDTAITISHSLNLASDISINYAVKASLLTNYDSFYLEVQRPVYNGNAMTGFKTIKIDPVLTGNYYYFTMTDITAVNMNDELVAILHMTKGNQEYISKTDSYSIVTYALNQLNKDTAADKLKTLCADLLRYGAAAQNFKGYRTDAGATVPMTDANRAWFSDINAVTFGNTNMVHNDLTNPLITWAGKTLNLESKVVVKFIFNAGAYTGNISNLTLRMVYRDNSGIYRTVTLTDPAVYNEAKRQYAFEFDGLLAAELRTALSVAVYSGDVQLSPTLQYSPDTYGNNKTGNLGELCKALFAYSDSAKAYFS